jgi:DNA topoisomerase I
MTHIYINDIEYKRTILKYYLSMQFGGNNTYKWKTFVHNGILFPAEYVPHYVPLTYNGQDVKLSPLAEEYAMLYAKYITTDYVKNKIFNRNFWYDWKNVLDKDSIIQSLDGCDFTKYNQIIQDNKTKDKSITIDECKFKVAIVDGKEQPVGNYRMEPPGLFMGRGDNPKMGHIKHRVFPENVTINIDKDAVIPKPYNINGVYENHNWKNVIHDRSVEWIASWIDHVTGKNKYVWLGAHSDIKTLNDQKKFDTAHKLKKKIKHIIEVNFQNLKSEDIKKRQIATALYFIDKLALRAGNEKSSDEADTVGVTSLRVEHLKLKEKTLELDFLGKDSVRYYNEISIEPVIYRNISEFMKGKTTGDNLFDLITSCDVNNYLQEFMSDLTAKVFRTYNGSNIFQKELKKITNKYEGKEVSISILMDEYSKANGKVAKFLNHQKNIAKSHKGQLNKLGEMIKIQKNKLRLAKKKAKNTDKIKIIQDNIKKLREKKDYKAEMKNISLGTSKNNYIDPRITVAFMKKHNIPVDKIFNKALQQKFAWAFDVTEDYRF